LENTVSKITRATLKSFVRKNSGKLFIQVKSSFDGMVDGVVQADGARFGKAVPTDLHHEHTLGVQGAWIVGGGRDSLTAYDDGAFSGIRVYNSCGSFILAVKK
jgi:hypothetical protein